MTTITIDRLEAIDLLKTVSRDKLDYVYKKPEGEAHCQYYDTNTHEPSCLVGYALVEAGVPLDFIRNLDKLDGQPYGELDEDRYQRTYQGTSVSDFHGTDALNNDIVWLTEGAEDVFRIAQDNQDCGIAWGPSVERAALKGKGE